MNVEKASSFIIGAAKWIVISVFALFVISAIMGIFRIPVETSSGSHTVQVTAIEKTGLFFKTDVVYVKTDLASTQEEQYCLNKDLDNYQELKDTLVYAQKTKQTVNIEFKNYLSKGITHCNGEPAEISSVELNTQERKGTGIIRTPQ